MQNKGLLLVTMEPPGALEEEFQAWYDTEHVPQRRAVPGIETACRFVCLAGWPRYLALYDLLTPAVMESAAYQAISGSHVSPWSRRLLSRVVGYTRVVAEQIYPGTALLGQDQPIVRLALVRFSGIGTDQEKSLVSGLCSALEPLPGFTRVRLFKGMDSLAGTIWGLAEYAIPLDLALFSQGLLAVEAFRPDLVNLYTPYWSSHERR